jgi:hypothetical protein
MPDPEVCPDFNFKIGLVNSLSFSKKVYIKLMNVKCGTNMNDIIFGWMGAIWYYI